MANKTNLFSSVSKQGYVRFFCNSPYTKQVKAPFTNPYVIQCETLGLSDHIDPDNGGNVVYTDIPIGTKFIISRVEGGYTTVGVAVGDCDLTWNDQVDYSYDQKVITVTNTQPLEIEFEGSTKYKKGGTYALKTLPEFVADRTVFYYDVNDPDTFDTFTITCIKDVSAISGRDHLHLAQCNTTVALTDCEVSGFGQSSYSKGMQCVGKYKMYDHLQLIFTDREHVGGGTN